MSEPADKLEYGTVIKDGDLYRLYTRDGCGAKFDGDETEVTRYCESRDGIHWTKPKLGICEIDGSKENNVILHEPLVCHDFTPFLDKRPGVPAEQRFKALGGIQIYKNPAKSPKTADEALADLLPGGGLFAFTSADGIHWQKLRDQPVITYPDFAFDSANVSFWSEAEQCYVCYFRTWRTRHGRLRTISRTTSQDYISWTKPVALNPNFPGEQLYTNETHPYFRAPHIYIALPARFVPRGRGTTDILFMTARGDGPYDRTFREAFIRPGLDPTRWGHKENYTALNVVPTGPSEMSIYATPFRRFTLRTDGFASLNAGAFVIG